MDAAGPIDVLVNNAGIGWLSPLEGTPIAAARERRRLDIREGRRVIVGTTAYRMPGETRDAALVSCPAPPSPFAPGGMPSLRDDEMIEPGGSAA